MMLRCNKAFFLIFKQSKPYFKQNTKTSYSPPIFHFQKSYPRPLIILYSLFVLTYPLSLHPPQTPHTSRAQRQMSLYYGRVVKRAAALQESLGGKGGAASEDLLFSMAVHEECFTGREVGRTLRATLEEGDKRDLPKHSAAARTVLEKFLDPACRDLFEHTATQDEHTPHVNALLFPLSERIVKVLHLIASSETPERAAVLFEPIFLGLSEHLKQSKGTEDPAALGVLEALLSSPHVALACVNQRCFITGETGAAFVEETVLGPFFAHRTALLTDIFSISADGKAALNNAFKGRCLQPQYYKRLATIIKQKFLAPSPTQHPLLRPGILRFFHTFLKLNTEGRKSMQNRAECSAFNALLNLFGVLMVLVEPLHTKPTGSIKSSYTLSSVGLKRPLALPGDEARIACDSADIPEGYGVDDEHGFSCEIFHLSQLALECSLAAHMRYNEQLQRYDIPYIQQELRELNMAPNVLPNVEVTRKRLKERLDVRIQTILELQIYHLNPSEFLLSLLKFVDFSARLMTKLALNASSDEAALQCLHIPEECPAWPSMEWKILPEFYIVNTCKVLQWISGDGGGPQASEGFKSLISEGASLGGLLTQITLLMASPQLVKNPYTRALQVETLYKVFEAANARCPHRDQSATMISACLNVPVVSNHLVEALMRSYVDLENLGGSNQFFEKFSFRLFLSVVLRKLYSHSFFKSKLVQLSGKKQVQTAPQEAASPARKQDVVFVKFFNMMLNDANYLLSEGVKLIKKLHEYEELTSKPGEWAAMASDQRRNLEANYQSATQDVQPYLKLSNEAIGLVHLLIRDTPEAFLMPALVGKVASMLDSFLVELAGPDVKSLRVKEPQKYSFDHAGLVQQLVECYLCLSRAESRDSFFKGVAEDERSYSPDSFAAVVGFCERKAAILKLSESDLYSLRDVQATLQHYFSKMSLDLTDVDIPENLQDPIMATLLEDPVKLPGSGEWCDRKVITQHLLNDSKNPFNRAPLSLDELELYNEDPEIKKAAQNLALEAKEFLEKLRQEREVN